MTDFNDVFNTYYNRVRDLESSICSAFQYVSGVNEGSFKSSSVISPSGEIAEDKVLQIMSKNPKDLTTADKEILQYANTILGKDKYLKDYNEIIGKKVKDLMLKNPSKVTEDESYYLETIKGIIGEEQYTKLRESIGNPLPPSMRPTEYNKSPYSITINITEDDMNAFIFATESNPYTAPVGIGLEEIPVGAKYLKSVLSKVAAIGKEEEIVADVSKTISEGGKISK